MITFKTLKNIQAVQNPFTVILETWIKPEKGGEEQITRKNKNGGGVTLYVDNNFKHKVV